MRSVGRLCALSVCLIAYMLSPCLAARQKQEEELGKEYARQVEQQCKLLKDKAV